MTTYPDGKEKLERYRREARKERLLKKGVSWRLASAALLRRWAERLEGTFTPKLDQRSMVEYGEVKKKWH